MSAISSSLPAVSQQPPAPPPQVKETQGHQPDHDGDAGAAAAKPAQAAPSGGRGTVLDISA